MQHFILTIAVLVGLNGFTQPVSANPTHTQQITTSTRVAPAHYHVKYHIDSKRVRHFHDHKSAHKFKEFAEAIGCHATIKHADHYYDVYYHMHGSKTATFHSDAAAHLYEGWLHGLGMAIHAKVVHHN